MCSADQQTYSCNHIAGTTLSGRLQIVVQAFTSDVGQGLLCILQLVGHQARGLLISCVPLAPSQYFGTYLDEHPVLERMRDLVPSKVDAIVSVQLPVHGQVTF